MNYLDWFNALFNSVFLMIGVWTAISWMHKQIYVFKNAQKLKAVLKDTGTKINMLEAFWVVSDYIEPVKFTKVKLKWDGANDNLTPPKH